jgi:6-phosphogluconate dehydrogenase
MELGVIGLGRMGTNMVRRLMRAGHHCVVYDLQPGAVQTIAKEGAVGTASLKEFAGKLKSPRAVWMMVPAAVVEATLETLVPRGRSTTLRGPCSRKIRSFASTISSGKRRS